MPTPTWLPTLFTSLGLLACGCPHAVADTPDKPAAIPVDISADVQANTPLSSDKPLLVMLQGEQLQRIRDAVGASGARITHDLPIISAIGARMSAAQLARVRSQPYVERIIDDLAYEPSPELGATAECPLAGSLELEWRGSAAAWRLYNKGDVPLPLSQIDATWPEELGELTGATLGDKTLGLPETTGAANSRSIATEKADLPPGEHRTLQLTFENAPTSGPGAQSAMELTATSSVSCSTKLIPAYGSPRLDSYYPTVSGAALLHQHGLTGAGTTVAVLDSGLWEKSAALTQDTQGQGKVLARYDAVLGEEVAQATDESGHGTHMTSVIADSRPVTRKDAYKPSYRGIAPDAALVIIKAFDATGEAGFLDLVRGIQWVVEHRERLNIRVLNLSFASRPRWPYWDDPVNQALMRAWDAGIAVIVAAGNEGPEPLTVGSPGNLPYVITVGAITDSWTENDRNDDYLPDFSSRGPTPMGHIKPDIVAYGGHIAGITPPDGTLARDFPEYFLPDGSFVMTGSSQAAAVVSGLAALLLQAAPGVSNDDIKCMLMSSAEPAISSDGRLAYSPFLQGSGLVNVSRALTVGERGCGNEGLVLSEDLARSDHFRGPAEFPDDGGPPTLPGQSELISPLQPEKGTSDTRRWGAAAHLERLDDPTLPAPIDWLGIFKAEMERMNALTNDSI